MRAVVIAIKGNKAAIVGKDGSFEYIENDCYQVGQILEIREEATTKKDVEEKSDLQGINLSHAEGEEKNKKQSEKGALNGKEKVWNVFKSGKLRVFRTERFASLAAAAVLIILTGAVLLNATSAYTVTIAGDVSVNMNVNMFGRVVKVTSGDIKNDASYSGVLFKELPDAFSTVLSEIERNSDSERTEVFVSASAEATNFLGRNKTDTAIAELIEVTNSLNQGETENKIIFDVSGEAGLQKEEQGRAYDSSDEINKKEEGQKEEGKDNSGAPIKQGTFDADSKKLMDDDSQRNDIKNPENNRGNAQDGRNSGLEGEGKPEKQEPGKADGSNQAAPDAGKGGASPVVPESGKQGGGTSAAPDAGKGGASSVVPESEKQGGSNSAAPDSGKVGANPVVPESGKQGGSNSAAPDSGKGGASPVVPESGKQGGSTSTAPDSGKGGTNPVVPDSGKQGWGTSVTPDSEGGREANSLAPDPGNGSGTKSEATDSAGFGGGGSETADPGINGGDNMGTSEPERNVEPNPEAGASLQSSDGDEGMPEPENPGLPLHEHAGTEYMPEGDY
ncbi:MAG: hypothetical protein K6E91_00925 [Butyrivibrio sp.]|nr:hypothetical protein [Butyrivibrio sp.]